MLLALLGREKPSSETASLGNEIAFSLDQSAREKGRKSHRRRFYLFSVAHADSGPVVCRDGDGHIAS